MFIVTFLNNTGTERLPLRGTVIAFDMERAQRFETREAAQAALDTIKSRKLYKAATLKTAMIEEV